MKSSRLSNNLPLKIISLIFAIILWFIAIGEENPEISRNYVDIPVKTKSETDLRAKGLTLVYDAEEPVSARLRGRARDLNKVDEENLEGYIDLSDIDRPGEYKLPVEIGGVPSGIRVEKQPVREILINRLVTKELPIEVKIDGEEASGYQVQPYTIKPDSIRIQGPQLLIDKIVQARLIMELKGNKEPVEVSLPIKILDKDDKEISSRYIKTSQDYAIVNIPIYPKKTVPIEANITGTPATGYEVAGVEVRPKDIVISGEKALLDGIKSISTDIVDVEGAYSDIQKTVKLQVNNKLYVEPTQPLQVDVLVRIKEAEVQKQVSINKIDVVNIGEGKVVQLDTSAANITVAGVKSTVDSLENQLIRLYVDAGGVSRGKKKLPVKAELPSGVRMVSMEPQEVTVTVK
ncbi:MAG: CdaR family protein [Xylanivirga thermophila]|uniref:CdaR family protein n=1 Tax=Xylanivirga thermophila TaxID=2496273 RepID=UPI0013EC9ED9|nr:CdaR family protein [Xylanivirga thermophila]